MNIRATRRAALLWAALCLLAAPLQADILFVGNKSAHTVWGVDLATGERRVTFESGIGPHEIEISPDDRYAVVTTTRPSGRKAMPWGRVFSPRSTTRATLPAGQSITVRLLPTSSRLP